MNKREIKKLEEHIKAIIPTSGDLPRVKGLDIFGKSFQLNRHLGGDHIIYVDFKQRFDLNFLIERAKKSRKFEEDKKIIIEKLNRAKHKAGILIADVSGHEKTDVVLTNGFHQAFLTGVNYELRENGDVSLELFDILNTRFMNSSSRTKYFTLIYGEFHESGEFRFVSAGHPLPLVYSREYRRLCNLQNSKYASSLPMSMFPSSHKMSEFTSHSTNISTKFITNKARIHKTGDIVFFFTDGFSEHSNSKGELYYTPNEGKRGGRLQEIINENNNLSAKDLFYKIKEDMLNFGKQEDDISFVIIKRI